MILSSIWYCLSNHISWCIDLVFLLVVKLLYKSKAISKLAARMCMKQLCLLITLNFVNIMRMSHAFPGLTLFPIPIIALCGHNKKIGSSPFRSTPINHAVKMVLKLNHGLLRPASFITLWFKVVLFQTNHRFRLCDKLWLNRNGSGCFQTPPH